MVLCIYVKTCWGQVKMVAIFKIYGITSHKWTEKKKKIEQLLIQSHPFALTWQNNVKSDNNVTNNI